MASDSSELKGSPLPDAFTRPGAERAAGTWPHAGPASLPAGGRPLAPDTRRYFVVRGGAGGSGAAGAGSGRLRLGAAGGDSSRSRRAASSCFGPLQAAHCNTTGAWQCTQDCARGAGILVAAVRVYRGLQRPVGRVPAVALAAATGGVAAKGFSTIGRVPRDAWMAASKP